MGKVKEFDINLYNASGVFYPGQVIAGNVILELTEPMTMRGIQLTFVGSANVHWSENESCDNGSHPYCRRSHINESDSDKRHSITVLFNAHEAYFDQRVLLCGQWEGQNSFKLWAGNHIFPFSYTLPVGLPSSFEGEVCRVTYGIECKINISMYPDYNLVLPFTVLTTLNIQPHLNERIQSVDSIQIGCSCCSSGIVSGILHIERQGFVPGELIQIFGEVSNASSKKMKDSLVILYVVTDCRATDCGGRRKTNRTTEEVARISRGPIKPHSIQRWSGEALVVPPLTPSYLHGCSIIDIWYMLKVHVLPAGRCTCDLDLEIPFEIVIGTTIIKPMLGHTQIGY